MMWYWWILLALVLGAVELMSTTFVLLWIAIAALVTGLASTFLADMWIQAAVFTVLSLLLLASTRRLSAQLRTGKTTYISRVDQLVGESGLVVTPIDTGRYGTVRVGSEVWSARLEPLADPLAPGVWVQVVKVDSSVLVVRQSHEVDARKGTS